jgi:hypothetical protein
MSTETDIEKELQARVDFKMNEFLTALKNRVAIKYGQAFDMTQQSQNIWKAFKEVSEMVHKEMRMPTPYDKMVVEAKRKKKNIAVDKIVHGFKLESSHRIHVIVSAIEEAQDY